MYSFGRTIKKVIVDSNIIFSALKGEDSKTRFRILNSENIQLYSPNFLIVEIFKYKEAIINKSNASVDDTLNLLYRLLSKITFINEESISVSNFIKAYKLCKDIDEKDTPFIALSLEMGFEVWTRGKELKNGLMLKGFNYFFEENEN